MAAGGAAGLREEQRYGLSCGRLGQDNITVLHVKLTETAIRALETYQSHKNLIPFRPSIQFQGLQGLVKIPRNDPINEVHTFNFYLSNVGKDNPQGSFDCIQQRFSSSGASQLNCLGFIQDKITVCATNDSYQMTRERMTQAEEESRNRSTKVIKPGGPYVGKRVQIRKAPQALSDAVPERKRSTPMNPANTIRKTHCSSSVSQRPYRDRVIHLLALKAYKKPELLARLQKDGVNQKDKNSLGAILQQVANLNPKDLSYTLKDYVFKELQRDWPGYNEIDRRSLEFVLSKKLNASQNAASTRRSESPVCSSRDIASSPQKRLLESEFIDPLMNKKARISHLTNRVPPTLNGHLNSTSEKSAGLLPPPAAAAIPTAPPLPSNHLPASNPPQTVDSNSNSPSTPEGRGTQDLPVDSFSQNSSNCEDQQDKYTSRTSLETLPSDSVLLKCPKPMEENHSMSHKKSKKKSKKHKEKDQIKIHDIEMNEEKEEDLKGDEEIAKLNNSSPDSSEGVKEGCPASMEPSSTIELPDYLIKYIAIVSYEQRQNYKADFNAEYDEYRALHARMETVARRFIKLDAQRKRLSPGSKEYQNVHEEVLQEYQKIKQSSPNYHEEKYRCEYLHNKLAHIKRLIGEFDQQQAEAWH
ncbi:RNA polymerase II elongation factor ELL2 isoform X1 [Myotis myotis]|uniref:Elongation factor for RNA polymerase II 2 n=1 Tax=Myotis myotis TaxID=51298 RepID=A0A7J7XZJ8_MYOMY|nr:RNA polymerase II elongation factor ELL2 isoform X1 [Myotis myotis]KAF6354750.1 elongation factor for RNA polymerase II 2 [Myotis myotis]